MPDISMLAFSSLAAMVEISTEAHQGIHIELSFNPLRGLQITGNSSRTVAPSPRMDPTALENTFILIQKTHNRVRRVAAGDLMVRLDVSGRGSDRQQIWRYRDTGLTRPVLAHTQTPRI